MPEASVVSNLYGKIPRYIKIGLVLGPGTYETDFKGRFGNTQAAGAAPVFQESSLLLPANTAEVCSLACPQLDDGDLRRDAWIKRT